MQGIEMIISNLHKLIDRKTELFKEIRKVTLDQKHDIEDNEGNNIESLVEQKQQVISKIDEIDKAFSQQFDMLKKQLGIARLDDIDIKKYPQLGDLKGKVQVIMSLAQEIMVVEQDNRDKINVIFNNLKAELRKVNAGKKSLRAYETPVINNGGVYFDKKTK